MFPEIIRYSKWHRGLAIFYVFFLIAAGVFILWQLIAASGFLSSSPQFSLENIVFAGIPLFLAGLFSILAAVTVFRAIKYQFFRMEFMEDGFQMKSFTAGGRAVANYRYEDVIQVKRGLSRGEVAVDLAGARTLRLTPFLYEGKENRLIEEYKKHLSPGKIEADLPASLRKYKGFDKIAYPLLGAILVGLILTSGQDAGLDFLKSRSGWQDMVPWKLGTFYNAISVDEAGAIWFANHDVDGKVVTAGRIKNGAAQTWDIPSTAFAAGDSAYAIAGVTGNAKGLPVVIMESYLIDRTDTGWKNFALPGKFSKYDGFSTVGYSLQFFIADQATYHYWSCELVGGICRESPLPDVMKDTKVHPISYRALLSEPSLAAAATDGPIHFLRFHQGAWQEITQPLDLPSNAFLAFTISADGTVWVTRDLMQNQAWDRYTKGPLALGHWDKTAGQWRWSAMDEFPGSFEQGVGSMEVDPRGRIWISGNYRTSDIIIGRTASAYSINGEQAEEIIRYTDQNSNFQTDVYDCPMVQGPDGRLWSCDSSLVSLDAAAVKLPAVIPDWFANFGQTKYGLTIASIVCGLEAAYFAVLGFIWWRRKRSTATSSAGKEPLS